MKRAKKNWDESEPAETNSDFQTGSRDPDRMKPWLTSIKFMGVLLTILMAASVMFSLSTVLRDPPSDTVMEGEGANRFLQITHQKEASENGLPETLDYPKKEELSNILVPGFDKESCLSRYESSLYRKELPYKPSSHLISRLRRYEDLHRQCGPFTEPYNKALEKLKSGNQSGGNSDCSYVVWISYSGLGNKIITVASAFLYALLTNRVLLIDPGVDMVDPFCEPFPNTSWFLPPDFPLNNHFDGFDRKSPHRYGEMLKNNVSDTPSFVYLHLAHDYDYYDKLFFCEENQAFLEKIPWLVMKTNNYFVPSLFLIPSFKQELENLFPNKEMVFHFLGRYLFHPTNQVWGMVTRYYRAYLDRTDERIGIQIRVFDTGVGPFQYVLDQILACTTEQKLLPEVDKQRLIHRSHTQNRKSKAVLITSLSSGYFEKIRDMYWQHPTVTQEMISIHQPSQEKYQQTEKKMHNRRAWAEIYLLSLTDALITSSWSTFGYVAQGLGGLKPWILYKPENRTAPDPPCRRAVSMEPCFHAPAFYDCKAKRGADTGKIVAHVRHCEDMSWGLKLVDRDEF